jgi:hypothetical protein
MPLVAGRPLTFFAAPLAGGGPAASHFLCLAKESNPRKATPKAAARCASGARMSWAPGRARVTRCAQTDAGFIGLRPISFGSLRTGKKVKSKSKSKSDGEAEPAGLLFLPCDAADSWRSSAGLLSATCLSAASCRAARRRPPRIGHPATDAVSHGAAAGVPPFFAFFLGRFKERRWPPGHPRQSSCKGQNQFKGTNR